MPIGYRRVSPSVRSSCCGLQAGWWVHTRRSNTMETMYNRGDRHVAHKGRGIFLVYVDIDAEHDKEFNEWYNTEHLPELLAVPGILAAARYEAVKGGPKYLACYELENVEVMHTPAFTNRPRTPWGERVSPSVIGTNLTRIVGEQIYPDRIEMPERGMTPVQGPPLLPTPPPALLTSILVGDLFYERSTASVLWAWLRTAHRQGVRVLIADASRPFAPTAGVRCLREARLATAWAWERTHARTVRLLTLDV